MTNKSLEFVDKMLGTNLAEEMKQQQPQATPQQTQPTQQPVATQKPKTEAQQLKEQLEVIKLRQKLLQEQQKAAVGQQPQQIQTQTTPPPRQPSIIPHVQQNTSESFNSDTHIHKKQAAIEVLKQLNKAKMQAYISIAGMFVTAVTSVLSSFGGAAVAGVFTIGLAFVLWKDIRYAKYLESAYSIVPQKKGV